MSKQSKTKRPPDSPSPKLRARSIYAVLRTFLWVSIITVLVWVWADLERTAEQTYTIQVRVIEKGTDLRITEPDPARPALVQVTLEASSSVLEQFSRRHSQSPTVLQIPANQNWTAGPQTLDLSEPMRDWARQRGLTVTGLSPDRLELQVDRWVSRRARVRFEHSRDIVLAGAATVSPAEVEIRVPQSMLATLPDPLVIPTDELNLHGEPMNQQLTRTVGLAEEIEGVPVRLAQVAQVEVTFRIGQNVRAAAVPLEIRVLADPEVAQAMARGTFELERRDELQWRPTVRVEGPAVTINQIEADPSMVTAYIRLTPADLEPVGSWLERQAELDLPEGVSLVSPRAPTVEFRFRSAGAVGP